MKKSSVKKNKERQVPKGIKAISIFFYAIAGFCALVGFGFFLEGIGVKSLHNFLHWSMYGPSGYIYSLSFTLFPDIVLIFWTFFLPILIAILSFFIAREMQKTKQWARILAIIFFCSGILGRAFLILIFSIPAAGLEDAPTTIWVISWSLGVVIYAIAGVYLIFSNKVKRAFIIN